MPNSTPKFSHVEEFMIRKYALLYGLDAVKEKARAISIVRVRASFPQEMSRTKIVNPFDISFSFDTKDLKTDKSLNKIAKKVAELEKERPTLYEGVETSGACFVRYEPPNNFVTKWTRYVVKRNDKGQMVGLDLNSSLWDKEEVWRVLEKLQKETIRENKMCKEKEEREKKQKSKVKTDKVKISWRFGWGNDFFVFSDNTKIEWCNLTFQETEHI